MACGVPCAGYTLNIKISKRAMTEEQKERKRAKKREYAKQYYHNRKDDPEFKERVRKYRATYMERHGDKVREKGRNYYHDNHDRVLAYHHKYYEEHKDEMRQRSKKWKEDHPERYRELIERRKQRIKAEKEEKKVLPPASEIATIFKNPAAAEHYKWLMQKRGRLKQESEVEHEVTT